MNIPRAGNMTAFRFREMRQGGQADFTQRADRPRNSRTVRCRVCRSKVSPGEGHGYDEYMTGGYRFARRYVCGQCFKETA